MRDADILKSGSEIIDMKILLASPGTGKTTKVKDLVRNDYSGSEILVLSFTNATVNDLKSSLADIKNVSCYTLHSYALRINHTEAFFGTNDFYPFVRAELQQHDPLMYQLLKKLWKVE